MHPPSVPPGRSPGVVGGSRVLANAVCRRKRAPEGAGRRGAGGDTGLLPDDGGASRIELETEGGRRQDERQSRQGCWTKGGVGWDDREQSWTPCQCACSAVRVCVSACPSVSCAARR